MYEILKKINDTTFLAEENMNIFLLKRIDHEDEYIFNILKEIISRNVARIFGTTVIDNCLYAVCEYVQGITLEKYIETKGCMSDDEAEKFALQLCAGLIAIHSKGIVHRDITPSNIMITQDGELKIIDFGISRVVKKEAGSDTHILGTHGYAAPEQFGFHQTSPKTDIYAAGVVINFMKTGCLPNENLAEGRFRNIIKKCIEIDENNRYESAQALSKAISSSRFFDNDFKAENIANILYYIPGFRRGKKIINTISAVYYFLCVILAVSIEFKGYSTVVGDYIPMFFIFWLSYFLFWDIGSWTKRLGFNTNDKKAWIMTRTAAALISFAIGIVVIIITATPS